MKARQPKPFGIGSDQKRTVGVKECVSKCEVGPQGTIMEKDVRYSGLSHASSDEQTLKNETNVREGGAVSSVMTKVCEQNTRDRESYLREGCETPCPGTCLHLTNTR